MGRTVFSFKKKLFPQIEASVLALGAQKQYFSFLHSNGHVNTYSRYNWIAAWDAAQLLSSNTNSFKALQSFRRQYKDWLFGHLDYSLKNQVEKLNNRHKSDFSFKALAFFVPEIVVYEQQNLIVVESLLPLTKREFIELLKTAPEQSSKKLNLPVIFTNNTSRQAYKKNVDKLKQHLQYGNIYEINYCLNFTATADIEKPHILFSTLNENSKAPFSAFYKNKEQYLLCASPERYLYKENTKLVTQPIKGTAARHMERTLDDLSKKRLQASEKEQAENVMIVDLMRNDLSRTAKPSSVKVEELFGIYSFNAVHQMISTVSSELDEAYDLEDALSTTFPMGSMTGAPKYSAMQLIDEFEDFNRDLYSGSVGYISPDGNCDFNVVIRSFLYNGNTHQLSVRVGSAITILANADDEYNECLLKAEKLFETLR